MPRHLLRRLEINRTVLLIDVFGTVLMLGATGLDYGLKIFSFEQRMKQIVKFYFLYFFSTNKNYFLLSFSEIWSYPNSCCLVPNTSNDH